MKEEIISILAGLGMIAFITSATVILKKFFNNMATSGALCCVLLVIGFVYLIILLEMEYSAYKAQNCQAGQ